MCTSFVAFRRSLLLLTRAVGIPDEGTHVRRQPYETTRRRGAHVQLCCGGRGASTHPFQTMQERYKRCWCGEASDATNLTMAGASWNTPRMRGFGILATHDSAPADRCSASVPAGHCIDPLDTRPCHARCNTCSVGLAATPCAGMIGTLHPWRSRCIAVEGHGILGCE